MTTSTTGPLIVFDTDCVLCAGMVGFVLEHERDDRLRFVGAWSAEGQALAARHGFRKEDLDETFLVIRDGRALTRSDAGLAILPHLRAPWCWLMFLRIVPRPWRDAAYTFVARRRYRWFGRRDDCVRVSAEQRHRFLGLTSTGSS